MTQFEYRSIAAPRKTRRVKGAKTTPERYAASLSEALNTEARDGWEFIRAETLPVDTKKNFWSSATESFVSVLVFRRLAREKAQTTVKPAPSTAADRPEPTPAPAPKPAPKPTPAPRQEPALTAPEKPVTPDAGSAKKDE